MIASQSISRISFVLPTASAEEPSARAAYADPCQEMLVDALTRAVRVRGVQVERHQLGRTGHGGSRADLAVWFPQVDGGIPKLDRREISSDLHAVYVHNLKGPMELAVDYDAVMVPHESLQAPLDEKLLDISKKGQESLVLPMPLVPAKGTISENKTSGQLSEPSVMLDVREDFAEHIDRVVFQVALAKHEMTPVFLVPHESGSRQRVRHLCERHDVSGFLASGPEAICHSISDIDDFIGRPTWAELMVLALSQTPCAYWELETPPKDPLLDHLQKERVIGRVAGMLQLAVALDRRLADPGGLVAQGTMLKSQLVGDAKRFLDEAAQIQFQPSRGRRTGLWEAVGPAARPAVEEKSAAVDARDAESPMVEAGQGVEDALMELKKKLGLMEAPK